MAATDFPKVIDAGGLHSEVLEHAKNAVITPHEGEAARLLNTSVEEVRGTDTMQRNASMNDLDT